MDATGTIFVGDFRSHTVRTITPTGTVSTLAGQMGTPGIADGTGSAALFQYPSGVALDTSGTVYVTDAENDTVRVVAPGGVVTTLAGKAGRTSSVNGVGADARFEDPFATAVDLSGNIYVADSAAHVIRKINPAAVVTTFAGSPGRFGSADGVGAAARFYSPFGVATDSAGFVYVADSRNSTVRKISPAGAVTTLAGTALQSGSADGSGAAARFLPAVRHRGRFRRHRLRVRREPDDHSQDYARWRRDDAGGQLGKPRQCGRDGNGGAIQGALRHRG